MSDKYSIDDILAEIDRKRSSEGGSEKHSGEVTESVTEIIGGSELDSLMRSTGAKTRMSESERLEQERAEEEAARERAESIRRAAEANERRKAEQKQKKAEAKAEAEEKRRREREEKERLAQERRLEKERLEQQRKEQERLEQERLEAERREQERLEAERAAAESSVQFTHEPEEPAEPDHTGFTGELASPVEAAKLFSENEPQEVVQPQSEYVQPFVKPEVSGADDDIIFHTRSDLVTTETMKMRKLQRIEEINRALLAADRAAEEPDDLVDSLNPMESRKKAVEELNHAAESQQEIGDTLAVSGNDLKKMSGGETEHVKEYSPVTSRKKHQSSADDILFTPGAQKKSEGASEKDRRGSDALIASLNQKLKEQREKSIAEERTVTLTDLSDPKNLPPRALNIDYDNKVIDTSILPKTDPVAAVQEAEALAARKKRRISSFMLADIDDETDADETADDTDEDEEEDEVIDLDDENVITERLSRAGKGLTGRLVILGILTLLTGAVTFLFEFSRGMIPPITGLGLSSADVFLYACLTLGILSFGACSSVITNGFSRLLKGKPDGDTLCAFAHIGALGSLLIYLADTNLLAQNKSFVFLFVSLLSLCFNTVSKLCTVNAAKNNFRFISGDTEKYYAECSAGEDAEQLARGAVRGFPVIASMRKTEMLCDFIISTYCEDISDRISRILTPVILGLSVIGGAIGFFTFPEKDNIMNQWSMAATVFSAALCIGASFIGALIVMLPMLNASQKTNERRAAILGYSAVEDFSSVNAVLVEAKSLFPAGSVAIRNIWDYNKNGTNGSQHVTIDEAIIYAASLAVSSDSILADPLFNMLNYKPALLKKVSNCVYESGLGVSGWIGSRRVLLGSRDHMKSHGIVVPDSKKEAALNKKKDEVVYLAVAGEVCMLFFVTLSANPQVKNHVRRLAKNGVSLIIKTVDGALSEGIVSELFDIYADNVRILPAEAHDQFEEHTKYSGKGSAAVSCDGTFSSLASAINGAKSLRERIMMGCIMEIAGIALGVLLLFIFSAFSQFTMLHSFCIAGYNALWLILTVMVMSFRRI